MAGERPRGESIFGCGCHLWTIGGTGQIPNPFTPRKAKINIITVGSMVATNGPKNGEKYIWSGGGSAATVTAPGNEDCTTALGDEDQVVAPDLTIVIISVLLAYFLSLPNRAPKLIGVGNTPKAVSQYLKMMLR